MARANSLRGETHSLSVTRLEQIIATFEEAWQRGERPAIDAHLPSAEAVRRSVLVELVHADLEYRLKAGEAARVESYLERYPELAADGDAVAGLIAAEYALRRRTEPELSTAEYLERFPQHRQTVAERLHSAATVKPPTREVPPKPGLPRLPGYEVVDELGRGGMGVVYRARQTELDRLVALKMIRAGAHAEAEEVARFLAEARAVARLRHAHIVHIYEVGEYEGQPFFSMEYVEGTTLARQLNGTPLPGQEAAQLVETLARAIDAAHQAGVVHRDLKPANILLQRTTTTDGTDGTDRDKSGNLSSVLSVSSVVDFLPKITDFGLAKRLDEATGQTQSGAVVGTPSYMAPEQAAGKSKAVGPAADVYALGAILYELLTGRPPFRGATSWDTVVQVLTEEPVPVRRLQPRAARDLETICHKCLDKDPARRYASAQALADDLRRFLSGEPIKARPVSPLERALKWVRRRPAAAGLLGAAVLGVVLLAAFLGWDAARERASRAEALVRSLVEGEITRVPQRIVELAPHRPQADPLLTRLAAESGPQTRERLHAALALASQDPGQVPYLRDRMLQAGPDELLVIRGIVKPYGGGLKAPLWEVCEDVNADRARRFRAACALAAYDADSPRWGGVSRDVAKTLVAENVLHVGRWAEALWQVRGKLSGPLTAIVRDRHGPEAERAVATSVLADYAADQPDLLAKLLLEADERQYRVFLPKLLAHGQRAAVLMSAELDRTLTPAWKDPPLKAKWADPAPALVADLEKSGGLLAERFALAQTLPLDRVAAVAERLRRCGYRPIRLRPYPAGGGVQTAMVWTRDGRDWRLALGLSAADVRKQDAQWRRRQYVLADLAAYPADGERYAALWVEARAGEESRLYLGVSEPEHHNASKPLDREGFVPMTLQAVVLDGSRTHYCSVWRKGNGVWSNAWGNDEPGYAGQHGDKVPVDIGLVRGADRPGAPDPECRYCGVWHVRKGIEPARLLGLDPATHLKECRALAAEGYRPAALSVAEVPGPEGSGESLVAASLWYRPLVTEAARDALARRQAQAAVTLLRLERPERVWPLLRHGPDTRLRTFLIHLLSPLGADPEKVRQRLTEEPDLSVKRALILCLGGFGEDRFPAGARRLLAPELLRTYRDSPDPGLHSAAEWLLRRWGHDADLRKIDVELAGKSQGARRWYVTREGHTLTVVPAGREFLMGSPFREPDRFAENETPHRRRIPRAFAIATKEVTVAQFRRFLEANPDVKAKHAYLKKFSPDDDGPAINVTWYQAMQYCNWLSQQEGIPPEEWCYPPIDQIKEGMELKKGYLERTGYRLPTEAEWEYACRAGAVTSRYYGSADGLLKEYAWYSPVSRDERTSPVGHFKPNDLGLFDTLGNVMEWCQDHALRYWPARRGEALADGEDADFVVTNAQPRALRGGSYYHHALNLRAASRLTTEPSQSNPGVGLRVARTHRPGGPK
jgi:serine/threonine protein kinase/formylglycine-generating enzyme required for sulfatase activity